MTNTFKKYTAGVYVMKSSEDFKHGDETIIETKYNKEVEVMVWKKLGHYADGDKSYSVIRLDGMNSKQRLLNKAEKREDWAKGANQKADMFYKKSNEHKDFLVLGEPIKIGHHSERRHRRIIEQAQNNTGKMVEQMDKAKNHLNKAEGLKDAAESIFIDVPECLEQLKVHIESLQEQVQEAKEAKEEKFVITNLQANIRRYKKRLDTAHKLWFIEK